jgi:hypothetical protein
LPNRLICLGVLNELDVSRFVNYKPEDGLNIYIKPLYPGIGNYAIKLKEINLMIKQGTIIPSNIIISNVRNISLDSFLVNTDGFYVDINSTIFEFRKQAITLCNLMEDSDTAETGIHAHNARILTKLFNDILLITSKLVEVTIK